MIILFVSIRLKEKLVIFAKDYGRSRIFYISYTIRRQAGKPRPCCLALSLGRSPLLARRAAVGVAKCA